MAKFLILISVLGILIVPVYSYAVVLVPCGINNKDVLEKNPEYAEPCSFNHAMQLINNIISFILFYMAVPIAAIMFAYAGFLLVTSGGSEEAKTRAKSIFTDAVIGLVIAVAAFLIIKTILSIVGYDKSWIFG